MHRVFIPGSLVDYKIVFEDERVAVHGYTDGEIQRYIIDLLIAHTNLNGNTVNDVCLAVWKEIGRSLVDSLACRFYMYGYDNEDRKLETWKHLIVPVLKKIGLDQLIVKKEEK
jgi:hypothetical protein